MTDKLIIEKPSIYHLWQIEELKVSLGRLFIAHAELFHTFDECHANIIDLEIILRRFYLDISFYSYISYVTTSPVST